MSLPARLLLLGIASASLASCLGCPLAGGKTEFECDDDEREVNESCVPGAILNGSLPRPLPSDIAVDPSGKRYVRGTLLVLFEDPSISESTAAELLRGQGGELNGSLPFMGLYRARFASASTLEALESIRAALEGDKRVAYAQVDEVIEAAAAQVPDRKRNTDLEERALQSYYRDYDEVWKDTVTLSPVS